ncbi:transforming growth factor beta regulator 1 L homeolog isoform X1 [Xenopus laevis]|uniref:LOC100049131 protein n=2 Tax=Xenopus laevis TaxID=8355 RepID=A4FVE8_XENLA|nr:transforming growth factor beta regulator 1 L homeolog [Xenopus laevis]XP_018100144.1 transforming growth factor beta regulator 1 L homeolog isoform X1 [Xenopus laevis]XP_018100145.1 transforming growth factor beta regulator 1 L homeolog isoform X1 [Xenopus laevis]XP_018100146.1 transforming growth factor beta regulator 1 L homeolog isoform X1 [Xenopus laevis]XP_018100148.1 transforming growth factor beta regulator 1 L homeolog isoform X1 [Xenopus laevis]XP_041436689.1 transforming growth f
MNHSPAATFSPHSRYQELKAKNKKSTKKSHKEKYRLKCLRLRRVAKAMVFENAALCDEIARIEDKFIKAKEERRFLLKRLLQLQTLSEEEPGTSHNSNVSTGYSVPDMAGMNEGNLDMCFSSVLDDGGSCKKIKKDKREKGKENKSEAMKKPSKKKRVTEGTTRKWVQPIALDQCGRPVLPIVLKGLTVYSLGEIISDRAEFHDKVAIYPVGFCSTRVYVSMKNTDQKCLYTCQIKDGGTRPQFEIVPDDDPQNSIVANSANECHSILLQKISTSLGKRFSTPDLAGAYFFGFTHPTIQNLIQSCPGARKCTSYQWVKFEVCKAGEEQVPHDICESSASVNFEAFQRQSFESIKNSNVLTGALDLPEIHASHDYISTYQEIFLSHSQLTSGMQHIKSPSNQYSPSRSSE